MKSTVELLDHQFSDLMVVNAARVSFGKWHDEFDGIADKRLINYLMKHKHWSPFSHPHACVRIPKAVFRADKLITQPNILAGLSISECDDRGMYEIIGSAYALLALSVNQDYMPLYWYVKDNLPVTTDVFTKYNELPFKMDKSKGQSPVVPVSVDGKIYSFRVRAPIFVARQLVKHRVGLAWNEISRRYVDVGIDFYYPEYWRGVAEDKKQGSNDSTMYEESVPFSYDSLISMGECWYESNSHICPEQRRMILPQSMMTEWIWTGTKDAWDRVIELRTAEDSQRECREVVNQIKELIYAE